MWSQQKTNLLLIRRMKHGISHLLWQELDHSKLKTTLNLEVLEAIKGRVHVSVFSMAACTRMQAVAQSRKA